MVREAQELSGGINSEGINYEANGLRSTAVYSFHRTRHYCEERIAEFQVSLMGRHRQGSWSQDGCPIQDVADFSLM
jgi:hypothetical protein